MKYLYKKYENFPSKSQIEFMDLAFDRYHYLIQEIESREITISSQQKFYYIKELLSIYTELESIKVIKQIIDNPPEGNMIKEFGNLFIALRNLLLHFPFFTEWDDVYFSKDIVLSKNPPFSRIDKYFNSNNQLDCWFRIGTKENLKEGKVRATDKYRRGQKVTLNEILSEEDGLNLLMGYSWIVLMSCFEKNDLILFSVT